jgi:beta-lactamase class A
MKKTNNIIILSVILLGGGILTGFLFGARDNAAISKSEEKYQYVNPSIEYHNDYVIRKSSYDPFRKDLLSFIDTETKTGNISYASIFFRDLKSGPTFGINDFENFAPASLLKLPVAMAYFQLEEDYPGTMKTKLKFTKYNDPIEQHFPSSREIQVGGIYSIEEMVSSMLTHSDNASYSLLLQFIRDNPDKKKYLDQTNRELGIDDSSAGSDETLTTHGYASIFRQLYNVSYLNKTSSNKILSWLIQSDLKEGLVAGVPGGIEVAHKFGERASGDNDSKQLHDCGIVYFPGNPYLLCVMTRGKNWDNLAGFIKTVSEKTYKEVESRRL